MSEDRFVLKNLGDAFGSGHQYYAVEDLKAGPVHAESFTVKILDTDGWVFQRLQRLVDFANQGASLEAEGKIHLNPAIVKEAQQKLRELGHGKQGPEFQTLTWRDRPPLL